MPQVPYSPVPEVAQTQQALPRMGIDTPAAAFGGASAEALGAFGKALDGAGDLIFNRAMALQQLDEQARARDAQTKYMIDAGQVYEEFKSLRGDQAAKGYTAYQEKLKTLRQDIRGSLTSPYAQRQYDNDTMGTMGRSIIYGAAHAAGENKRAVQASFLSQNAAYADEAARNPADERAFEAAVVKTRENVAGLEETQGLPAVAVEQKQSEAVSKLASARVRALAREQPIVAGEMMNRYVREGLLRGTDIEPVKAFVDTQRRTIGARQIDQQVNSGADLYWGSKPVTPTQAKLAIAKNEGNDYNAQGPETARWGRGLGKYQVMSKLLPDYLARAGLPPMTPAEFLKDKQAQETVFEKTFIADMEKYGSFNEAAARWFTGKPLAEALAKNPSDATATTRGMRVSEYIAKANGTLAVNTPLSARKARGEELARQAAPEDELFPEYVGDRISNSAAKANSVRVNDQFHARQTVTAAVLGQPGQQPPTTLDELFDQSPDAANAWSTMDPTTQRSMRNALKANAVADVAPSAAGDARYRELYGLYKSKDPAFLDVLVGDEKLLSRSEKRQLMKWQEDQKANPDGDPRVQKALGLMRGNFSVQLNTLRLDEPTKDREAYARYVGALAIALDNYLQTNKKPASDEDIIKKIGPMVLREQTVPGKLWGTNQVPFYNIEVPSAITQAMKDKAKAEGRPEPTDADIRRDYLRFKWQQLNTKPSAPAAPAASGPRPPVSQ